MKFSSPPQQPFQISYNLPPTRAVLPLILNPTIPITAARRDNEMLTVRGHGAIKCFLVIDLLI